MALKHYNCCQKALIGSKSELKKVYELNNNFDIRSISMCYIKETLKKFNRTTSSYTGH